MGSPDALARFRETVDGIRAEGLFKEERLLAGAQGVAIRLAGGREVLNFCANNYLGLAAHPEVIAAAKDALDHSGLGMASVRFICGTQELHRRLERAIAGFLGVDDAILYSSCFDANGGLFETLLGEEDAVISDALNHASIIDGIRLCKAQRYRYAHADVADLEAKLIEAKKHRSRLIATDGVFSMDGDVAPLDRIAQLARRHDALLMVDDSHATGFFGPTGRGSAELHGVLGEVDVFTSTLGKALGGASGGFAAGRREIIDLLRQRSRPYLFSNSLPPPLVAAGLKVFEMLSSSGALRERLEAGTRRFREGIRAAGFAIRPGIHPIVPILLGDAQLAQSMARELLEEGIYVIGFSYPVVPRGQARIRVQLSAAHEPEHIDRAIEAFTKVGKRLGVPS
jgi:glycine C-acetyltransferase